MTGRLVDRIKTGTDRQEEKWTNRRREKQERREETNRRTYRETDRVTERQTETQADRETGRLTIESIVWQTREKRQTKEVDRERAIEA